MGRAWRGIEAGTLKKLWPWGDCSCLLLKFTVIIIIIIFSFLSGVVCNLRLVTLSCTALYDPLDGSLAGSLDFPGKNTRVGCHFLLQGVLPNPGIESTSPVSLAWQTDSLPAEPSGSRKRTNTWNFMWTGYLELGSVGFKEEGGRGSRRESSSVGQLSLTVNLFFYAPLPMKLYIFICLFVW